MVVEAQQASTGVLGYFGADDDEGYLDAEEKPWKLSFVYLRSRLCNSLARHSKNSSLRLNSEASVFPAYEYLQKSHPFEMCRNQGVTHIENPWSIAEKCFAKPEKPEFCIAMHEKSKFCIAMHEKPDTLVSENGNKLPLGSL